MGGQSIIDFLSAVIGAVRFNPTDPLKFPQQALLIVIAILVILYIYTYRRRVIEVLTGDDRFHCNPLDTIWFTVFRCCGTCYGEWTRCFTQCPCCGWGCWKTLCCGYTCYRKNIVQELGKIFGVYTIPIELKNIVVGDLPFDYSHGDFYLSVEVGSNPPMVTSLQEDALPKVVHFPEILVIRLRNTLFEQRIRVVVKELNALGHVDLCDLFLSPLFVLDWMNDNDRMKRFQMRPCLNHELERETPPWICIEFGEQTEVRELDTLQDWRTNSVHVRTWVPGSTFKGEEAKNYLPADAIPGAHNEMKKGKGKSNFMQSLWSTNYEEEDRLLYDQDMDEFKKSYPLRDEAGMQLDIELPEDDLQKLECNRCCCAAIFHCVISLVTILWICYLFFRAYLYSCYRQYKLFTIAGLNHTAFPVSRAILYKLNKECNRMYEGTGADDGTTYCRPTHQQIYRHCEHGTQKPMAFQQLAYDWFGWADAPGVTCANGPIPRICEFRNKWIVDRNMDTWVCALALFTVLAICCLRCSINWFLTKKRARLQRHKALDTQQSRMQRANQKSRAGQTAGERLLSAGLATGLPHAGGRH